MRKPGVPLHTNQLSLNWAIHGLTEPSSLRAKRDYGKYPIQSHCLKVKETEYQGRKILPQGHLPKEQK